MQSARRSDRVAALYLAAVGLTVSAIWVVLLQGNGSQLFETLGYVLSGRNPSQGFFVFLAILSIGCFFLAAAYVWGAARRPPVAQLLFVACLALAAGCLYYGLWPLTLMLGLAGFYAFRGANGA